MCDMLEIEVDGPRIKTDGLVLESDEDIQEVKSLLVVDRFPEQIK